MLAQANLQVQAAQNQYNLNKTIENEVALIDARNNVKAVEAQIEGLRSEQIANRISLEKESLDLTKSKTQAESELATNQKLFDAERLKDEDKKLQAQKEALENQRVIELERLKSNIELYKQGTQARLEAENEYNAKKQELDNAVIAKQDEIDANNLNKQLEKKQLDIDNEALSFEERLNTLNEREKLITDATNLSESERTRLLKENSDARISIQEKETSAKLALMNAVANGLSIASQELGESTAAGKVAAVAAATISTYTAIAGQLAAFSNVPVPGYAIAQAIVTGATGLLQVKKILSVKTPKGGGGGTAPSNISGDGGAAPAPSFNVVGNSGVNQIAQTLGNQQPVQAYVVANNVTTAQSLDRNIVQNASLG
jgi:chromosome segregation ATPase